MNPDGQKEPIEERSGGSVTWEGEKWAKCTFAKDVLYSVYALTGPLLLPAVAPVKPFCFAINCWEKVGWQPK